jgi:hypothetical protein
MSHQKRTPARRIFGTARTGTVIVVLVGVTRLARPTAAEPSPTLTIVLQVPGYGGVRPDIVTRAKPVVARIYREAGVNIIWSDARSGAGEADTPRASRAFDPGFALVILPREVADQLNVATDALGGAAGTPECRGRMAYVFYNRVERIARTYLNASRRRAMDDIDTVIVLAHAIAHEVGHLLLPYGHSATGLMRAGWNGQDLQLAVRGQLKFTPEEAELFRTRLTQSLDFTSRTSLGARTRGFATCGS